ncbi:uncharacterized protein LOC135586930 isoform X2 [Musa acuminata AAA Group]|uniref:uncharacterized protein LOC135586930 isoform X2 n=1 Tax=Musa acuminata AAA Group TaxID=214697 RepID=UPI0031D93560
MSRSRSSRRPSPCSTRMAMDLMAEFKKVARTAYRQRPREAGRLGSASNMGFTPAVPGSIATLRNFSQYIRLHVTLYQKKERQTSKLKASREQKKQQARRTHI